MGGAGLSVGEVQRWNSAAVREVFHAGQDRARAAFDAAAGLAALGVFDSWGGDTALAARTALSRTRMDLDAHGTEAMAVAHAAGAAWSIAVPKMLNVASWLSTISTTRCCCGKSMHDAVVISQKPPFRPP